MCFGRLKEAQAKDFINKYMLENGKQKIWIVHITPCAPTVSALGFNPVT